MIIINLFDIISSKNCLVTGLNQYYHDRAFSFLFYYLSVRLFDKYLCILGYKQEMDHGNFFDRIWNRIVSDFQ